uniref:Putative ovule protein n=1 Tax=Solanum chacoense TaxID=4108 RepID=A0A0V0GP83_SOLCH
MLIYLVSLFCVALLLVAFGRRGSNSGHLHVIYLLSLVSCLCIVLFLLLYFFFFFFWVVCILYCFVVFLVCMSSI